MPLLTDSAYRPSLPFRNGHLQTIFPALFRKLAPPLFVRERIHTPDGDFLDLDWLRHSAKSTHQATRSMAAKPSSAAHLPPHDSNVRPSLAILTHGLEGSSAQGYIRGMAQALFAAGWDVLAWNFRGCSGTPNLHLRSYHSGANDDLATVIAHASAQAEPQGHWQGLDAGTTQPSPHAPFPAENNTPQPVDACTHTPQPTNAYTHIALVGFSLGGNIVLKHLGEIAQAAKKETEVATAQVKGVRPAEARAQSVTTAQPEAATRVLPQAQNVNIIGAVAISVPCGLAGSTKVLELRSNRIYMERFLKTLRQKIRDKHKSFPDALDIRGLDAIRTFREFDGRYTAPIHGFRDADHYWYACSCLRVVESINTPTLLLNAADDPFLSPGCYPAEIASAHPHLHLESPRHGGHVGFVRYAKDGQYYSEARACAFLAEALRNYDRTSNR